MAKKNQLVKILDANCLNCGHPFFGNEIFCPNCGQKNKGSKITVKSFIKEVFAGFFSWDAKFWRTLIPLLISPGKVSKDYIEGKRNRYTNPFRFYLSVSIIFFLILGLSDTYDKFQELNKKKKAQNTTENIAQEAAIDSLKNVFNEKIETQNIPIDSTTQKQLLAVLDTVKNTQRNKSKIPNQISFFGDSSNVRIDKFISFNRDHKDIEIDAALDSLEYEKTFFNRFLYDRARLANTFFKEKEKRNMLLSKVLSYSSISLFIFLPIFTLALKFLYIRRRYTYVEHLIFVFHTQTVFFLLLTIFLIASIILNPSTDYIGIFTLLFLLYLFIAMKKFYGQGFFKTMIKYIMINSVYMFLAIIGALLVGLSAFALF
ncbi:DUF3667 domain-containing protein [Tenacibaculum amylolyticum]|uniref:DUF3667 domain-containing protein n=1 Tax=Tenacibaculum amylolyticum TaxID=104269 RepID=UPI0038956323